MSITTEGLTLDRVHVWRGDRHVLKGVSLTVAPGEVVHVSGPNGSGKTTLLRVACGLLRAEDGRVEWQGTSIDAARNEFQCALAYASHEPALKADLTALENLHFWVGLRRRSAVTELTEYLRLTGVADCADLPARALSAGQRRRVSMARVLASQAALWLLDEPYSHLDAAGAQLQSNLLDKHVAAGGLAVVVAHHELNLVGRPRALSLAA